MKKAPLVLGIVLALTAAGAFFWYMSRQGTPPSGDMAAPAAPAPQGSVLTGRAAPAFSLPDISGNTIDSSRFSGKPTVINFFATWCPPCRGETPGFVEVYNRHKSAGFELVGISLDTDTKGNLPAFVMDNRIGYRILLGDLSTTRAYGGVTSIPTTVFIGKDGVVRNVHVGYIDAEAFDREVRKLL